MTENKWVTRVVTPMSGVTTIFTTRRGPHCVVNIFRTKKKLS